MMLVIYHLLERWFVGWLGPVGYVALIVFFVWILRRRALKAGGFLRHLWLDKREWLGTAAGRATTAAVILLLFVAVALVPLPTRVGGIFEVEAGGAVVVRAPAHALLDDVAVRDGERVAQGAILARLASPDLDAAAAIAAAESESARREAVQARASADPAAASASSERVRAAEARAAMLAERRERLVIRAPVAGVVVGYRVEELVGRWLAEGDEICRIIDPDHVRLGVRMSEREVEEVSLGTPVRVRAEALAGTTLRSKVESISPLAAAPPEGTTSDIDLVRRAHQVRVLVEIDNPQQRLLPGMSGQGQFELKRRSLAGQVWWRFSRWVSTVVW
jgi:putative peptide zinc metalloprotease protein